MELRMSQPLLLFFHCLHDRPTESNFLLQFYNVRATCWACAGKNNSTCHVWLISVFTLGVFNRLGRSGETT